MLARVESTSRRCNVLLGDGPVKELKENDEQECKLINANRSLLLVEGRVADIRIPVAHPPKISHYFQIFSRGP